MLTTALLLVCRVLLPDEPFGSRAVDPKPSAYVLGFMVTLDPGRPFSAHYQERWFALVAGQRKQTSQERGRLFVDSMGRVRAEMEEAGIVTLVDPVERASYLLDQSTNVVLLRQPFPTSPGPSPIAAAAGMGSAPEPEDSAPGSKMEQLGMKTVEGLQSSGIRWTRQGVVREAWIATMMSIPIHATEMSDTEERVFQLTDIELKEPDPVLFVAPQR